jgi:phytoene dehydrogenase-like protein
MSGVTRREFVKGAALAPLALTSLTLNQADPFDVVVAGAGHNSLVATAYLAKAGYRCLVLEEQQTIGGGVKTAEVTLPGFKQDLFSSVHDGIQANPMLRNDELKLADYGLEYIVPDPVIHMPFPDGSSITQWRDLERTYAEFARFSRKDAEAYRRMVAEFDSVKPIFGTVTFAPIGFAKPINELLAQHPKGKLWQRRLAMSAWEIVRDTFQDDHCRSFVLAIAHLPSIPPADPVSGRLAYLAAAHQATGRPIPKGGSGQLTQALARFIEAHGGAIFTNKRLERLIIENARCVGVECADGSSYRAEKAVLSTVHIKHLVGMAPRELWGQDFVDGVDTFEPEQAMFVTHYAVTEPVKFPIASGTLSPCESVILVTPERALRFTYDDARGLVNLKDPPLQILCCTVADPTRAPAGMHTLKINGYQPYALKEGPKHWDAIKNQVSDANLDCLRRFSPNLTNDKILAKFVESPLDLERMNSCFWRGGPHGGAQSPAQSGPMRPVPGWAQYRMPIPGLYQTGDTTYPGGSVTGAPGRNAAQVMLKDFGMSLEEVVSKRK